MSSLSDRIHDLFGDQRAPDGSLVRENFTHWFDGSKVVDVDGSPLVVYHGTRADFATFEHGADLGLHFGDADSANERLQEGNTIEGGTLMPVYLSIKNPLRLDDMFGCTFHSVEDTAASLVGLGVLTDDEVDEIANVSGFQESEPNVIKSAWAKIQAAIERAGYDGVVYDNEWEGGESWIAFHPQQIKSATGNPGTYLLSSKHIADEREVSFGASIDLSNTRQEQPDFESELRPARSRLLRP